MATVTVQGSATVPGEPDEAVISLEVSSLRPTPEEAYAEVAERSGRLDAVCDNLGVSRSARLTRGVAVREHREHDGVNWQHRGYTASNVVVVRLADPELVARLMKEAVSGVQARVAGPWWHLAETNPARLEACRLAAGDARRKAEAYTDALGARLGAIVEAREPDARGQLPQFGRPLSFSALDASDDAPVPVHAGELDVTAVIDVTFAIDHP